MSDNRHQGDSAVKPFFCFTVPIAPDEGSQRALLARLQELANRNRWLVRLRWAAAAGLAAAGAIGCFLLGLPVSPRAVFAVVAVLLLYNAVFAIATRARAKRGDLADDLKRAGLVATLQMTFDMVTLGVLLHYSGGVENPFLFYFVFHMIIASILFSRRASFYLATFAVALFSALAAGEYFGVLPHHPLWSFEIDLYRDPVYLPAVLAVFITTMYAAVYLAGDIVERLRARDRELINVSANLERGTLELQEAYQRIKALEERKSDFLRLASHQLRSPLSAIKSLLEVVVRGYTMSDRQQLEMLERAYDRTGGMLQMLNELSLLSRLEEIDGVQEAPGAAVDVCKVLAELNTLYAPKARAKGVTLTLAPPGEVCFITASAGDVQEALNNLLDNAINYTPAGGAVRLAAEGRGGKLVITVSDTGIGIEPQDMQKIFGEFYRALNARRLDSHGTGLGLAIVKRIVERWDGEISVESTLGEGTTFTLEFPIAGA